MMPFRSKRGHLIKYFNQIVYNCKGEGKIVVTFMHVHLATNIKFYNFVNILTQNFIGNLFQLLS